MCPIDPVNATTLEAVRAVNAIYAPVNPVSASIYTVDAIRAPIDAIRGPINAIRAAVDAIVSVAGVVVVGVVAAVSFSNVVPDAGDGARYVALVFKPGVLQALFHCKTAPGIWKIVFIEVAIRNNMNNSIVANLYYLLTINLYYKL